MFYFKSKAVGLIWYYCGCPIILLWLSNYFAEINNQIVGFGSLENKNYIYFLYVHKEYLGLGIASRIYEILEKESLENNQSQVTANVSKTALPFFENKGFQVVKENDNIINNVSIINYHMIKNYNLET